MAGRTSIDDETPPSPDATAEGVFTFLDLLIAIAKHKRLVVGLPLVVGVVTALVLVLLPNVYTATARIMPPQPNQSAAMAAFGAIATAAGGAGAALGSSLGVRNPNDLYVGILKSNTVADRLIERFSLKQRYSEDTSIGARLALEDRTSIRAGREGLIVVEVDDRDANLAAAMANAYVEELDRLTQQLAVTDAAQRRLFFERELKGVREALATSEMAMRTTQERTGLIQPEGQARAIFEAFAELRARIAAKEVELASMRTFATDQNPEYLRARQELASLKGQLGRLEKSHPDQNGGNILVPTTQVPEAGLEYLRRLRDVKYQETLYELLAKQYELAKIDEAKDAALIQVVDKAAPPDRKSKPRRALLLLLAVSVAAFAAILSALYLELLERTQLRPGGAERIHLLSSYLRK